MPARLTEEEQKEVQKSWDKALAPVGRLDHQLLLDVMVGTGAYQYGVDTVYFRSEKRFSGGRVVMEIHFDQANPVADRFEVKVVDPTGRTLREERYSRSEVEQTYRDLRPAPPGQPDDPARAARWERITEIFPKPKTEEPPPPGR
jgi:hypothetical protein